MEEDAPNLQPYSVPLAKCLPKMDTRVELAGGPKAGVISSITGRGRKKYDPNVSENC